jgi:putative ABC transport system permease protein
LMQKGSRAWTQQYYMLPEGTNLSEDTLKSLKKSVRAAKLEFESVDSRKEDVGDAFGAFGTFLNLVGFVSLLLGCIGVAGAVSIYIKDKLPTVAILRCLGASGWRAFWVYLIQIIGIGLVGALFGATLGTLLQKLLPWVLKDFLPLDNISTDFSPKSFLEGTLTGLAVAVLFALLPLSSILQTAPLSTLRAGFGEKTRVNFWLRAGVTTLIVLFLFGFSWLQIRDAKETFLFMIGIGGAFLLLWMMAKSLMFLLRKFFPKKWSYVGRQAVANLYRPDNQTVMLVVTIGLGTLLLSTLFLIQQLLLSQVSFSGAGNQPNLILFDIQSDQKEAVAAMLKSNNLPILQDVPIVAMRLDKIDGLEKEAYKKAQPDTTKRVHGWVWDKEFRVTYRDTLIETEKISEGIFPTEKTTAGEPIKISVSEGFLEDARLKMGSKITWNVSGVPLETEVASIRKVDFNRVQTNFLVLFPNGYLESAPQFRVLISRSKTPEQSAKIQGEVVQKFPNVSAIDLTQILRSVEEILKKVSFVIRFMALFSILTGLLVLLSSLYLSKYQRIKESVLLRTLGASRSQILWINGLEYFFLGALSCLAGAGLSVGAAFLLAKFAFKMPFHLDWWPLILIVSVITFLTVLIGLLNSREVVRKAPLEVLRGEG